jgi:hypothetical protein
VLIFFDLHFVGVKHYYPSLHREYLPVNAAALQAMRWALISPVLWLLQEYALRGSDLRASFWGLDWQIRRLVLAGAAFMVAATVVAWRWMLPLWGLAVAVALYLRFSRPKRQPVASDDECNGDLAPIDAESSLKPISAIQICPCRSESLSLISASICSASDFTRAIRASGSPPLISILGRSVCVALTFHAPPETSLRSK